MSPDEGKPRRLRPKATPQDKQIKKREDEWINSALLPNGEANPRRVWRNRESFGFTCPRIEFIESVEEPAIKTLCKKWSVSFGVMSKWRHDDKWDAERGRYWMAIEQEQRSLEQSSLSRTRFDEMAIQRGHYLRMRDSLVDMIRQGFIEEQTATGDVIKRPLGPKDMKDIVAALDAINKGIDKTLGISNAMAKLGEGEGGAGDNKPIRRVRHNFTVTVEREEAVPEVPELPEPEIRSDFDMAKDLLDAQFIEPDEDNL